MEEITEASMTNKLNHDKGHQYENQSSPFLSFYGNGAELFKLTIVNLLLNIVTLGIYYPWSKATKLKYLYSHTEFKSSRFNFMGTGKEMFRGFIKIYTVIILFYIALFYALSHQNMKLYGATVIVFFVFMILIMPLAIHGALRYRLSRSTWRSIRFGYRGSSSELYRIYGIGILLTILTCGFYIFWLTIELYRYIFKNIRFGDIEMRYNGEGSDFFILNLKGTILTIITCYIYGFWYQKDIFEYHIRNTEFIQNGKSIPLDTRVSGMDFVELIIVNSLLLVFTLGLAMPWVVCRTLEFYFRHILMSGDFDANAIKQTEEKYTNATGEDFLDHADLDLGLLDF